MDAIARALGVDAVEFRLRHLNDERMRAVLDGGGASSPAGRSRPRRGSALGIACGTEKGSYVATAAELSKTAATASPSSASSWRSSAARSSIRTGCTTRSKASVVQGLGGALFEAIEFDNGAILNGTMAQYRVPRFKDVPPIEIMLLDRKDLPSAGAGETPIVCVAPAIGAAARAFGQVANELPVRLA